MNQQTLKLTPGGPPLAQSLGFSCVSVIVDNDTGLYVSLPDAGRVIPPWVHGAVVTFDVPVRTARGALMATNPTVPGPPVPVTQAVLTWTDDPLASNPGFSIATNLGLVATATIQSSPGVPATLTATDIWGRLRTCEGKALGNVPAYADFEEKPTHNPNPLYWDPFIAIPQLPEWTVSGNVTQTNATASGSTINIPQHGFIEAAQQFWQGKATFQVAWGAKPGAGVFRHVGYGDTTPESVVLRINGGTFIGQCVNGLGSAFVDLTSVFPADGDTAIHTYDIVWLPGVVLFGIDGAVKGVVKDFFPTHAIPLFMFSAAADTSANPLQSNFVRWVNHPKWWPSGTQDIVSGTANAPGAGTAIVSHVPSAGRYCRVTGIHADATEDNGFQLTIGASVVDRCRLRNSGEVDRVYANEWNSSLALVGDGATAIAVKNVSGGGVGSVYDASIEFCEITL